MATAAVCTALTGEDSLVVRDHPLAPLAPDEMRLAVRVASVNFPDGLIVRGRYQVRPDPPFVPGSECAGVIAEVGPDVRGWAVGDRVLAVVGTGAFAAEVTLRPATQVHRIPDEMPFDEAAAFDLTFGTAYHGLVRRGLLRAGETVLVNGASGGCGSAAVQIAKAIGATVVAVAGGPEKCALAVSLGADVVIDHRATSPVAPAVREATGGRGVDVLFDNVGGEDARDWLRCLAWNGRYLVVGFASGHIPTFAANQTILKGLSIVGVAYGMSAVLDPASNREDVEQLFAWYRVGKVRPSIGARYPLHRVADAVREVSERRAVGKVVVDISA